jgi:hypothetical protein
MVLFETRGLQLSSVIRGGIGWEWRLEQAYGLTFPWILVLEPSVSRRTRLATAKDDPQGMERTLGPKRSSCLRFQLFRVEMSYKRGCRVKNTSPRRNARIVFPASSPPYCRQFFFSCLTVLACRGAAL